MGLGSTCRALPCAHLLHGKKIPVKGRSPYSSKSAIEIFSGNFSQSIYCHFWFSWYVTSCHIFNFRVILGSTFWFDDLVNNIETHHLDLFTNIDWTFELYTFHWNLRCQYFWKCDCPAWCYLRIWKRRVPQQLWGGVGIWVSSAQRENVCDMHLCARMFLNARCTEVDKNWEYQVYKEHRPQFSTL